MAASLARLAKMARKEEGDLHGNWGGNPKGGPKGAGGGGVGKAQGKGKGIKGAYWGCGEAGHRQVDCPKINELGADKSEEEKQQESAEQHTWHTRRGHGHTLWTRHGPDNSLRTSPLALTAHSHRTPPTTHAYAGALHADVRAQRHGALNHASPRRTAYAR